ncbi:MAG: efflux RND transporter permease subunit, partial [Blastocatellia bacterium]
LIAIGASYMFHVLNQCRLSMNEYIAYVAKKPRSESADSPSDPAARSPLVTAQARRSCWLDGLQFIIPAVLVSGLATMAGFAALTSSSIPTARDMGAFNAVGVAVMLALTLLFVPAALSVIPAHAFQPRSSKHTEYAKPVGRLLRHVAALVMFRRPLVWLAFVGAFVLMTAGAFRMRVETDYLGIFPKTSPTVRDARLLHERIAGASTVEVVVSGGPDALYSPAFLRAVANLEQFALTQPGVDAALSVSDIVKRINSVVDPSSGEVIPVEAGRIKSLFRDFLSNEPDIKRLVAPADTGQGSRAVIVLRTSLSASSSLHVLTAALAGWASANLPPGIKARATGSVVLLNDASDAVASSQMSSLALALISIYVMMVLLFRSFACGLLALIPNLLPTIGFFGFLGWFSIPLDLTTSLVATSALGLAVDNAVHLIRRYRQCSAMGRNKGWVMWLTLVRTGKPMVLANLTLIAGFLIFMASSFVPVRLAGLLWAVTIAACLAADLVFLPVLMTAKWFEKSASGSAPEGAGGLPRGADSAVKTSF